MNITRREALKLGLAGGGVLLSPWVFAGKAWADTDPCHQEPLPLTTEPIKLSPLIRERRFEAELPIPTPLKCITSKTYTVKRRGVTLEQPIDYYEITMRQETVEILPAKADKPALVAKFWTYNGMVPGPLIRQQKNRESCIRFINNLGKDAKTKEDICLVNGRIYPHLKVKRQKYFFRILNASTSRTYQLILGRDETSQTKGDTAYQLAVVGSDAGLLAEPAYLTAPVPLRIGVAERYGVIIDFSKFPKDVKQVYLKNLAFPFNLGTEPSALMRFDLLDDPVIVKPLLGSKPHKLFLR
jgi:FtsP/CotA-like multicopper oxidase with cupredoxin domain